MKKTRKQLQLAVRSWNNKSSADIQAIYLEYYKTSYFVNALIDMLADNTVERGASWLLKQYCDQNEALNKSTSSHIYRSLPKLKHWETKLHVLQSMAKLPVPKNLLNKVETFVRDCLNSPKTFVRAWAYDGFYQLALQFPEYQNEVKIFFEMAMRDEAASVKARIRNILKQGF